MRLLEQELDFHKKHLPHGEDGDFGRVAKTHLFLFLFSFGDQANIRTSVNFRACVNVHPTGVWQAKGSTLPHPRLPNPHLSKTATVLGQKAS